MNTVTAKSIAQFYNGKLESPFKYVWFWYKWSRKQKNEVKKNIAKLQKGHSGTE